MNERCYALMISNTANFGAEHTTVVRDGGVTSPTTAFVISTMWVAMTDNWWVEAGYGEGKFVCGSYTVPRWYTARFNASGYQESCITGNPGAGSTHVVTIERLSSPTTSWQVKIDGVLRYTHTSMKVLSSRLDQGVEASFWQTHLVDGWHYGYRHKPTLTSWAAPVWPSPTTIFIGANSAYGYVQAPYAIWVHGFQGL